MAKQTEKQAEDQEPEQQPEQQPENQPLTPQVTSPQVYEPGQEQPSTLPKGPSLGDDAKKEN